MSGVPSRVLIDLPMRSSGESSLDASARGDNNFQSPISRRLCHRHVLTQPDCGEAAAPQLVDDSVSTSIAKRIAKAHRVVSTRLVVVDVLNLQGAISRAKLKRHWSPSPGDTGGLSCSG